VVVMQTNVRGLRVVPEGLVGAVGGGRERWRVPGRAAGPPGSNRPEGGRGTAGTVAIGTQAA